ncbi:DUF1127 domain-containing protein [uncultured Shimia sp.]|uniref:DUF1127 domain-containing protein n=1 Tax=uncultured Shimia sp. TaxID=573152 RepID=UPI002627C41A|nr:DUF1127 domain-containing protein [uncultured Shimia sp.]
MAQANTYTHASDTAGEGFAGFVSALTERFRKARLYYRTYNELAELPDAMLADMGLHRSMLRRVAYQAVYED